MESAAEALKMILGVTIFGLALTVLFRMTSLARDTADQIFSTIDTTMYQRVESDEIQNENRRNVKFEEIIPSLYRYIQEGYGVVIIEPQEKNISYNNIISIFDSEIEGNVSMCKWSFIEYRGTSTKEKNNTLARKKIIEEYINNNVLNEKILNQYSNEDNKYIITKFDSGKDSVVENTDGTSEYRSHNDLDVLMKKIYKNVNTSNSPVYIGWLSSNRDRDSYITQRVNCDVYGGKTFFNSKYSGVGTITNSRETNGGHEAVCGEAGLLATYKNATFTEYINVIDTNEYIDDSDLLKYGTIRYAKKREIIYVKN